MTASPPASDPEPTQRLTDEVGRRAARESMNLLAPESNGDVARTLQGVRTAVAMDILSQFDEERRKSILAQVPPEQAKQWAFNLHFAEDTVGRLMEPPRNEG